MKNLVQNFALKNADISTCQVEIHFSSQTTKFLIKYNILRLKTSGTRLGILFAKHDYSVLASFIKENK